MFYHELPIDPGKMEQNAWDDGFEDGMNEILSLIDEFKDTNKEKFGFRIVVEKLEEYIEINKPRRNR